MKFFKLSDLLSGGFSVFFGFDYAHNYRACFSLSCIAQVTGTRTLGWKWWDMTKAQGLTVGTWTCHSPQSAIDYQILGTEIPFWGTHSLWLPMQPREHACTPAMPWILRNPHAHSSPNYSCRQSGRIASDRWAVLI